MDYRSVNTWSLGVHVLPRRQRVAATERGAGDSGLRGRRSASTGPRVLGGSFAQGTSWLWAKAGKGCTTPASSSSATLARMATLASEIRSSAGTRPAAPAFSLGLLADHAGLLAGLASMPLLTVFCAALAQGQETAEELAETVGGVGEPSGAAEGKGQRQREELTMPGPSANSPPASRAMPVASSIASRPASVTAAEAHSKTTSVRGGASSVLRLGCRRARRSWPWPPQPE